MAKGEKGFSTQGMKKTVYKSEPFAVGDYGLKILGDTAEVKKKKDDPKAFPYVNVAFEALGTGEEGQKNRRVYHMLFCRVKPSEKDGSIMPARADQVKGLADAAGGAINLPYVTVLGEDIISPQALVKWLKAHDGEVVQAHVKIQKGTGGYADKNIVDFFKDAEEGGASTDEDEEETEEDEEAEETDKDESEDEADEEDEAEDDIDAAASKGKKKPAKKGKK